MAPKASSNWNLVRELGLQKSLVARPLVGIPQRYAKHGLLASHCVFLWFGIPTLQRLTSKRKGVLSCLLCEKATRCPIGNFEEEIRFELSALRKAPRYPIGNFEEEVRFELFALRKGYKMPNRELRRRMGF